MTLAALPAQTAGATPRPAMPGGSASGTSAPGVAQEPQPQTMTFADFLSGLNPLHHLPVVGTIYRAATGESIPPVMRVLGGGLLGGPLGMLSAAVMAAIDEFRGAPDAPVYAASISQERMSGDA
ncbi:hypothetical protein [Falsiroseomonas sp. CW058]|uniref:hypothetical protein n=1 Tax=Falsiroseomonas sp. CW058 TaxID=3388664 RepID=UPI003D319464